MLQKILIKNVALIESAEINFSKGLNVLSGETGAGKSVILESLNFVLGAKAEKTLIRSGAEECFVKAEFYVGKNNEIYNLCNELDVEFDDQLIISRKFTFDGKSAVKINGETVTIGMLKKFTSALVDVHGQSEHFHLLKNSNQLDLIDKFGGAEILEVKDRLGSLYGDLRRLLAEYNALGGSESERLMRIDLLKYQINEIESVNMKENEEEELLLIREKLKHQEKISNALKSTSYAISDDGGVCDVLNNLAKQVSTLIDFGTEYSELYERIMNVCADVEDISSSADGILEGIDFYQYSPDEIEDRIATIKTLKKKYGNDFTEINTFLEKAKEEVARLEDYNQTAKDFEDKISRIKSDVYKKHVELHDLRKSYAGKFSSNVLNELLSLGMPKAKFEVKLSDLPTFDECKFDSVNGADALEFMFTANLGEPLKPLSSIISGGEISRFMLAIKAQTAKYNEVSTFIFDEIDTGISGNIAKVVAEKFAIIAKDVQIIAISHLPQVSAMADNNLFIEKTDDGKVTRTTIRALDKEMKIFEVIRLVGGDKDSVVAKRHAEELISQANEFKNSI